MNIHELEAAVSQIFLSCDLTGSTDFKQRESTVPWQKVFLQFYREFPQTVATTQRECGTQDLKFTLWKPVGDELIYSCVVHSEDDVYGAVRTWIAAMETYKRQSLNDTTMGTKGGAFIATFPGPDSRSSVPREPDLEVSDADVVLLNREAHIIQQHDNYLYDYFGPSIDTGFRVLSKSDSRYFTLSVEVALAMIGRSKTLGTTQAEFHVNDLVLLDFVVLKGVWRGKRCPIVAVDLEYKDPVNKAYSKFERRGTPDDILELCRACYMAPDWPSKLYLPSSHDDHFLVEPADPLAVLATTSSEGVEREATDEPDDVVELTDDAPLGEASYRTGFQQLKLPPDLTPEEVEAELRRAIEGQLLPNEVLSRLRPQPVIPAAEANLRIYSAYWGTRIVPQ